MNLSTVGDTGRAKGKFPAANDSLGNRDGKASSGTDAAMIEEVVSIGFEVIDVEYPSTIRNGYPELMLFIALAVKRDEPTVISGTEPKYRSGNGNQRRRLIVVAVEGPKCPVEAGNSQSGAKAGTDRVLGNSARKVGRANSC